jgi:hypothetical protein
VSHFGLGHLIVTTAAKAVVYDLVFKIMRHFTLPEAAIAAAIVLAAAAIYFSRSARD